MLLLKSLAKLKGKDYENYLELALLSKIIKEKNLEMVLKLGVNESDFLNFRFREIFKLLLENPQADVPYIKACGFPDFHTIPVKDNLDVIVRKLKEISLRALVNEFLSEHRLSKLKTEEDARNYFLRIADKFSSRNGEGDEDGSIGIPNVVEEFLAGDQGIPWPWQSMNEMVRGIKGGDYIVIYGPPKSRKTFLLLFLISHFYSLGLKSCFSSFELTKNILWRRLLSFLFKFDYSRIQKFELSGDELERFRNVRIEEGKLKFLELPQKLESVMGKLEGKGKFYNAIFLDSIHFIGTKWDEIAEFSRSLKRLAVKLGKPVFVTTQANRNIKRVKNEDSAIEDIAYSVALIQDADLVIRVKKDQDKCYLSLPESRESETSGFLINAKVGYDFSEVKEEDIF